MSMTYAYNYAEIDPSTGECLGMFSTTAQRPETEYIIEIPVNDPSTGECLGMFSTTAQRPETEYIIEIPVNDPEYVGKYYINGAWYEDAAGTTPWTSSLL